MKTKTTLITAAAVTVHLCMPIILIAADYATYYPLTQQNRWTYRRTVEAASPRVEQMDRAVVGTEVLDGQAYFIVRTSSALLGPVKEWIRVSPEGITVRYREVSGKRVKLDPPNVILKLPITQGQVWEWAGEVSGAGKVVKLVVKYSNQGNEEIKTPLFQGSAVKIVGSVYKAATLKDNEALSRFFPGSRDVKVEIAQPTPIIINTRWFAPNVGLAKETEESKLDGLKVTDELTKFVPASGGSAKGKHDRPHSVETLKP